MKFHFPNLLCLGLLLCCLATTSCVTSSSKNMLSTVDIGPIETSSKSLIIKTKPFKIKHMTMGEDDFTTGLLSSLISSKIYSNVSLTEEGDIELVSEIMHLETVAEMSQTDDKWSSPEFERYGHNTFLSVKYSLYSTSSNDLVWEKVISTRGNSIIDGINALGKRLAESSEIAARENFSQLIQNLANLENNRSGTVETRIPFPAKVATDQSSSAEDDVMAESYYGKKLDHYKYTSQMKYYGPFTLIWRSKNAELEKYSGVKLQISADKISPDGDNISCEDYIGGFSHLVTNFFSATNDDTSGSEKLLANIYLVECDLGNQALRWLDSGITGAGGTSLLAIMDVFEPDSDEPALKLYVRLHTSKAYARWPRDTFGISTMFGGDSDEVLQGMTYHMAAMLNTYINEQIGM